MTQSPAQQACILFPNVHAVLQDLTAELERRLASQGATILRSGVSPKRNEGFIVVEAARGIPSEVEQWLSDHPDISEWVVYDVPRQAQEDQATEESVRADEEDGEATPFPEYVPEQNPLPPPALPEGYKLHSQPRPLSTSHDTYWTAWAWGDEEGTGLLLYDEGGEAVAFFTAEEAMTLLYTLLERAQSDLLPRCQPAYLSQHAPGVAFVRAHLWALHVEVMRRAVEHGEARRRRKDKVNPVEGASEKAEREGEAQP